MLKPIRTLLLAIGLILAAIACTEPAPQNAASITSTPTNNLSTTATSEAQVALPSTPKPNPTLKPLVTTPPTSDSKTLLPAQITATPSPAPTNTIIPFQASTIENTTVVFSGDVADTLRKVKAAEERGDYGTALIELETAHRLFGDGSTHHHAVIYNRLALAYSATGDYENAIKYHSITIGINDNAVNRVNRAYAYADHGRCEKAVHDAQIASQMEVVIRDGYHSGALAAYLMGGCLIETGDYDTVLDHLTKAINLFASHGYPDDFLAAVQEEITGSYFLRGENYYETGDCNKALSDFTTVLNQDDIFQPGFSAHADASFYAAKCLQQNEQFSAALLHAERALNLTEEHQYPHNDIAVVRQLASDLRAAIGH